MIDPTVRRATPGDAAQLVELQIEARGGLAGQRGGERWLEEHREQDWVTTLSSDTVWVAHVGEVIVGYLVLDTPPSRIARVEQVYVTPAARGVGFGDELLAAAIAQARAGGAEWFEANALPGDRETKNLYERAGITAREITLSTRL